MPLAVLLYALTLSRLLFILTTNGGVKKD